MKLLDKKTAGDTVRLLIFILVTALATGLLVVIIGNLSFSKTTSYKALFTDATGVLKGDDVRIAGVKVGTVEGVKIVNRDQAEVDFNVDSDTAITDATNATLRYRNLLGQRYLSLSSGIGGTDPLPADAEIPLSRTHPALDLTVLFNGFKPLFQALSPDDLNKLSYEIIQVFQGESGTVEDLLQSTASVTNTLADRDQVIGQLIDNLNDVLANLGSRDQQLSSLIISFRNLIDGLKNDRQAILGSLGSISDLADQTASLVKGVRPPFVADIKQLRRFAGNTEKNLPELNRLLQVAPIKLTKVGRTAIYGSWFNFFLCDISGRLTLPTGQSYPLGFKIGAQRCNLG